eukprot:TRINITY_DN2155_c0_g1_i1.p1 TRINITY_DN2155_c0_g1~~TRINITY_DN2155_c0_g1_i1.p1  ORF type:complete len:487 (-),score=164.05 TRINITY_DN2155_c0_g1_i1:132-1592(-)
MSSFGESDDHELGLLSEEEINNQVTDRWAKKRMLILGLASLPPLVIPIASTSYLAILGEVQEHFDVSRFEVLQTITSYTLFTGIMPLIYGPLSDKYGRRILLIATLIAFFGATLMAGSAVTIYGLIILRGLQAITNGGLIIFSTAVVADVFPAEKRGMAVGLVMIPAMMGPIVGPNVGALLGDFIGWRSVFYALCLLVLVVAILTTLFLPETLESIVKQNEARNFEMTPDFQVPETPIQINQGFNFIPLKYRHYFNNPFFRSFGLFAKWPITLAVICNGTNFACVFTLVSQFPLLIKEYHPSVGLIESGLLLTVFGIGTVTGSVVGGKLADVMKQKIGVGAILCVSVAGCVLVTISTITFAWTVKYSIIVCTIASGFTGFGGMVNRNSIVAFCIQNAGFKLAGSATGLVLFTQFLVVAVELLFSTALSNAVGDEWALTIYALIIVVSLPCLIFPLLKTFRVGGPSKAIVTTPHDDFYDDGDDLLIS